MHETDLTMQRAEARVGALLNGRWRLDKLVGVGGMAAVYAATHRNSKRVAIKILHPEISSDEDARQRFLREGYAANQVGHCGAVTADDDGVTEDGVAFLVMELLEGETIDERSVRLGGTLRAREALALMDQALATLEVAHEKGIVHRDLKPENLFLTRDGVVKILDFGIARVHDQAARSPSQTQGVMGTPSFMAPEQARGRWEDVDRRTDLWAIGATLFTLISGRFVHPAETANEALVAAVTERAPRLASILPLIHPAIAALVDRALMYERELRFQSATEFRAALCAVDLAIAGDDASPSLSVPLEIVSGPLRSGPLSLTTEGVAASVRVARTHSGASRSHGARVFIAIAGLSLGALLVLFGRGLFSDAGKRITFASASLASSVDHDAVPRSTASVAVVAVVAVPKPLPAAPHDLTSAQSSASAPPQETHKLAPTPTRAVVRLPLSARVSAPASLPSKAHVLRTDADLLAKRH